MLDIKDLNESQRKVVEVENDLLAMANAGGGKTASITNRYLESKRKNKKTLLLAYNKHTANEMLEEVREENSQLANDKEIRTIHSQCFFLISRHIDLLDGLDEINDVHKMSDYKIKKMMVDILEQTAKEFKGHEKYGYRKEDFIKEIKRHTDHNENGDFQSNPIAYHLSDLISYAIKVQRTQEISINSKQAEMLPNEIIDLIEDPEFLDIALYNFIKRMEADNNITYELMLHYGHKVLETKRQQGYQGWFDEVIVDEAQDLNPLRYEIVKLIARDGQLILVGDPAQAIYGFNGSKPEIITEKFREDRTPEIVEFETNYRSQKDVVKLNNGIRKAMEDIPDYRETSHKGTTDHTGEYPILEDRLLNNLPKHIEKLQDEGVPLEEIRILSRYTVNLADAEKVLQEMGLPYTNLNALDIMTKKESRFIVDVMEAVKTEDPKKINKVIGNYTLGIGKTISQNLLQDYRTSNHTNYLEYLENTDLLTVPKIGEKKAGNIEGIVKLLTEINGNKGEDLIEAINQHNYFGDFLYRISNPSEDHPKTEEEMVQDRKETVEALKNRYNKSVDFNDFKTVDDKDDDDPTGIILSSIHKAKGSECHAVFYIGLEDQELNQEEVRLCYTAVSRAREKVFVETGRNPISKLVREAV